MQMAKKRGVSQVIVVLVTCPSTSVARRLGVALVRRRLCACVNLLPGVESLFRWKGKLDRCREALLLIKTTARRFRRLEQAVRALHPYEVPEVIALPVSSGSRPYLRWIASSVSAF